MKSTNYVVIERTVRQRKPEVYKRESDYISYEQMTALLENSRKTWADIDMVYQLCERRQATTGKKKIFDVVAVYLQGKPGKHDYKYVQGLDFLVPVLNVATDVLSFLKGDWNE